MSFYKKTIFFIGLLICLSPEFLAAQKKTNKNSYDIGVVLGVPMTIGPVIQWERKFFPTLSVVSKLIIGPNIRFHKDELTETPPYNDISLWLSTEIRYYFISDSKKKLKKNTPPSFFIALQPMLYVPSILNNAPDKNLRSSLFLNTGVKKKIGYNGCLALTVGINVLPSSDDSINFASVYFPAQLTASYTYTLVSSKKRHYKLPPRLR